MKFAMVHHGYKIHMTRNGKKTLCGKPVLVLCRDPRGTVKQSSFCRKCKQSNRLEKC